MLTIQSAAVLKGIRLLARDAETDFGFLFNSTCLCLTSDPERVYDYRKYAHEIHGIMDFLVEQGYLISTPGNQYRLTHHGLHPAQASLIQLRNFLLKDVLVPIAVSVATTLICLWLTGK